MARPHRVKLIPQRDHFIKQTDKSCSAGFFSSFFLIAFLSLEYANKTVPARKKKKNPEPGILLGPPMGSKSLKSCVRSHLKLNSPSGLLHFSPPKAEETHQPNSHHTFKILKKGLTQDSIPRIMA